MDRLIFHIDVNSAFLSWEATKRVLLGEPDIRTIPSAIGGTPGSRTGIITAKSIPAKRYGIKTGEPVSLALQKCPDLAIFPSDFSLYIKYSRAFKEICQEYSPEMESFSIDEVFLDMSGMKYIYSDPLATAYEIKDRIRENLGFTVNIGIGPNKLCAKMASDFEKPDKVHTLYKEEIPLKMWPLPVNELFTCGKASSARLNSMGIYTIGQLAAANIADLALLLGENTAKHLISFANGIDNSPVCSQTEDAKGYSSETTVEYDLDTIEAIDHILLAQADVVAARMRADNCKCSCISVTYRDLAFVTKSHQVKLTESTDVTEIIFKTAKTLIRDVWKGQALRLIGLALSDLQDDSYEQMSFLVDEQAEKQKLVDSTMDSLRNKFGNDIVKRASTVDLNHRINRKYLAEHDSKRST